MSDTLSTALKHHLAGRFGDAEALYRRVLDTAPEQPDALHLLGMVHAQTGRVEPAVALIRRAIARNPRSSDYHVNLANILLATGRPGEAAAAYRAALALKPAEPTASANLPKAMMAEADHRFDAGDLSGAASWYRLFLLLQPDSLDAVFNRAVALRRAGRSAEALAATARAVALQPRLARAHAEEGMARNDLGQPAAAADCFARAVRQEPGNAEFRNALGAALLADGRVEEADAAFRAAVAVAPEYLTPHLNRGVLLLRAGRHAEAIGVYRRVLVHDPAHAAALSSLSALLLGAGRHDEAVAAGLRAVSVDRDDADACINLGAALQAKDKLAAAEEVFRLALALRVDEAALGNLGAVVLQRGRVAESVALLRRAAALQPDRAETWSNLGGAMREQGDPAASIAAYRRALRVNPGYVDAHSNLIFVLDFDTSLTTVDHMEERRRFDAQHAAPMAAGALPHANPRDPDRRLRVGYVSADFRRHSAAFGFLPVLKRHDHDRFAVYCYSGVTREDDMTAECRRAADVWCDTLGMDDAALAGRIRADGIDILVDLSGHSLGNRLLTFARRPAPVQLSAWGHPHGIGVTAIGHIISDPVTIPYEERPIVPQEVVDLPCIIGYEAPPDAPPVVPPPALATGVVTFGCLNRLSKLTGDTLALWGRVMRAVPDARLLLKDKPLDDPSERRRILAALARHGVAEERVVLLGGSGHIEHLASYGRVDIALDPFPLNGGISTLESLWMGVPVLALRGRTPPSRVSAAIDTALGLADWVAEDWDDYVAIARAKAADGTALAALRARLRPHFAASPVGDMAQYTRAVEDAYRALWRRWCTESPSTSA
ncbi:MAG TPA: tetratricopeptide repeat protein [Azospirillum sp.]|nr:tetratricopeptide repeat protein [Azospirillum sp.]